MKHEMEFGAALDTMKRYLQSLDYSVREPRQAGFIADYDILVEMKDRTRLLLIKPDMAVGDFECLVILDGAGNRFFSRGKKLKSGKFKFKEFHETPYPVFGRPALREKQKGGDKK